MKPFRSMVIAVRAKCHRLARLLAPDVRNRLRIHNSTATGASLVVRPVANPFTVVFWRLAYHCVRGKNRRIPV